MTWRTFDLRRFGLADLSMASFQSLAKQLKSDRNFWGRYMIIRAGYDPDDPAEQATALNNQWPLVPEERSTNRCIWNQYCQMTANLEVLEMDRCLMTPPQFLSE